jgi:hypothetical protein
LHCVDGGDCWFSECDEVVECDVEDSVCNGGC